MVKRQAAKRTEEGKGEERTLTEYRTDRGHAEWFLSIVDLRV